MELLQTSGVLSLHFPLKLIEKATPAVGAFSSDYLKLCSPVFNMHYAFLRVVFLMLFQPLKMPPSPAPPKIPYAAY